MSINLSRVLFKTNLPSDVEKELTKSCQDAECKKELDSETKDVKIDTKKSWFGWFGKSDEVQNQSELTKELSELQIDVNIANSEVSSSAELTQYNTKTEKRFKKTIRLTSDQLKKLNLKSGMNEVEFSVTTAFQGTTRCRCHIYLWHHTDKVTCSVYITGTISHVRL